MTTMAENGVAQSPHDVLGAHLPEDGNYLTLPAISGLKISTPKQTTVPLFSQHLLTVEQLTEIDVDSDIQASVVEFLKGLSTQMFARIVRNGSVEVGGWLGAKIQGERDGWTAMLRMAMEEIECHRKNALQGQVVLQETLDQLRMLVDCFQLEDEVKKEMVTEDVTKGIRKCVQVLAQCCNALMEDRFQCVDILGCADPVPDSLSAVVQGVKNRMTELEAEKEALQKQCSQLTEETSQLRQQNDHLFEEIQKMEDKLKSKQDDLLVLKAQLKEIDKVVKFRKNNMVEKCVGTTLDFIKPAGKPPEATVLTSTTKQVQSVSTARENMYTQTLREPSFIELSEEKLRVLKERARKLENSLHGAIASMDKLRKATPCSSSKTSTSSSVPSAMFVALPTYRQPREPPKIWMSASFEVTNTTNASITAPVPKLGHFKPTERRCFSERPADRTADDQHDTKGKQDFRKLARTRTGQVSKCLRCLKLFTTTDNHKLACCFHSKGKERMEVYSDGGQLVKVKYVWKCCHQPGESDGCCYGHHV